MTTTARSTSAGGSAKGHLSTATANHVVSDKAVRLLASSIFRQLQDEGCKPKDIISVSSQLIDLVTSELQKLSEPNDL